jgi:hypothetical protein
VLQGDTGQPETAICKFCGWGKTGSKVQAGVSVLLSTNVWLGTKQILSHDQAEQPLLAKNGSS